MVINFHLVQSIFFLFSSVVRLALFLKYQLEVNWLHGIRCKLVHICMKSWEKLVYLTPQFNTLTTLDDTAWALRRPVIEQNAYIVRVIIFNRKYCQPSLTQFLYHTLPLIFALSPKRISIEIGHNLSAWMSSCLPK